MGSVPCVRKVAGSNPTLAAKYGPWASPSHTITLQYYCICAAESCKCTSELPVRRAISKLSYIVLYIVPAFLLIIMLLMVQERISLLLSCLNAYSGVENGSCIL